jgi:hypothetical protein
LLVYLNQYYLSTCYTQCVLWKREFDKKSSSQIVHDVNVVTHGVRLFM